MKWVLQPGSYHAECDTCRIALTLTVRNGRAFKAAREHLKAFPTHDVVLSRTQVMFLEKVT